MVVFGVLLGVVGVLFFIVGGAYPILRRFLVGVMKSNEGFPNLSNVLNASLEFSEWRSHVESEGIPRSRAVASLTLMCLFWLFVLAIWLSSAKMEWIPFISGFLAGEFGTIGLFEASRLRASHGTSSRDDNA
jgi:hypothetical protein